MSNVKRRLTDQLGMSGPVTCLVVLGSVLLVVVAVVVIYLVAWKVI